MREAGVKEKGQAKTIRIVPRGAPLAKPAWIRVRAPSPNSRFYEIKDILRRQRLHTVCEEASCPNIGECFGKGTATFMILGDICTRRCPFCDVAHGRPLAPDADEPRHLAETIAALRLNYVVITSVDRDDLRDGGAQHFVDCIRAVRAACARTTLTCSPSVNTCSRRRTTCRWSAMSSPRCFSCSRRRPPNSASGMRRSGL